MGAKTKDIVSYVTRSERSATKFTRMHAFKKLLLENPNGVKMSEIAELLDISPKAAHTYRMETGAVEAGTGQGFWTLLPNENDIELSILMLNRAVMDGNITQEMIDCAAGILEAARALQQQRR